MSHHRVDPGPYQIATTFVHLSDRGAAAPVVVNETFWEDLSAGKVASGGWLVSQSDFDGDWAHWEMHPNGEELVYLLSGSVDFVFEIEGGETIVELRQPGAYALVPRGVWHLAKALTKSSMLFVTSGEGTQHRPV